MGSKTWLDNIPEPTIRVQRHIPRELLLELTDLLEFIQETQPDATLDHLMEGVIEAFFKKSSPEFPVPDDTDRLSFTLRRGLIDQVEEAVAEAQKVSPKATDTHLYTEAVSDFLSRRTAMLVAWRSAREEAAGEEVEPAQEEEEVCEDELVEGDEVEATTPSREFALSSAS